jgi:hypothetical protein
MVVISSLWAFTIALMFKLGTVRLKENFIQTLKNTLQKSDKNAILKVDLSE